MNGDGVSIDGNYRSDDLSYKVCKMTNNIKFCRICLDIDTHGTFESIFSTKFSTCNNIAINRLVEECSSVQIDRDDTFPKLICSLCLENLIIAYKFKDLCLQTDKKLRENKNLLKLKKGDVTSSISSDLSEHTEFPNITLKPHAPIIKQYTCVYCSKVFKSETRRNSHQAIHTKRLVCEICGKVSGHETNFEIHMRTHTGDKPFECHVCGISKVTEGDLKSHMRTHSDECKYSCHICGRQFKWLSNHLRHMRWHKGERTHKCYVCGKLFFEADDVKKHMLTHTGEKPFGCHLCDRAFIRKCLLRTHYKAMHNIIMPP